MMLMLIMILQYLDRHDVDADHDFQITMMLMLIMILFFVCWTPLLLFNMLTSFDVIDPTLTQG
jgi:hypothetical protein